MLNISQFVRRQGAGAGHDPGRPDHQHLHGEELKKNAVSSIFINKIFPDAFKKKAQDIEVIFALIKPLVFNSQGKHL